VSDSSNPPTPKSHATVDVAEVEGVEGVGGATRALTRARHAEANPPNGEALYSIIVVGLGLKLVQTVLVPRDSLVTRYHTIIDEESGVASAYLGDSRFSNIMWCPKRLPPASLPRLHRAIIETLGANWLGASSGWVLDGVDYKTKLAWLNVVKNRATISIPVPRGSAMSDKQMRIQVRRGTNRITHTHTHAQTDTNTHSHARRHMHKKMRIQARTDTNR
jgi:hypothetical protein